MAVKLSTGAGVEPRGPLHGASRMQEVDGVIHLPVKRKLELPLQEVGQLRLGRDTHLAFRIVGDEAQRDRLEVDEQSVRADVIGSNRFVVEGRRIVCAGIEQTMVEHQIAAQVRDASRAQLP